MPLHYLLQDITTVRTEAIVNAANTRLAEGGGVCGAIFRAAGESLMSDACRALAPVATGEAVITPGFALPARAVIHAVGPIHDPRDPAGSARLLSRAYASSLALAKKEGMKSLAFPLISSGIYGYPLAEAFTIARKAIRTVLSTTDMEVFLVFLDRDMLVLAPDDDTPAPHARSSLREGESLAQYITRTVPDGRTLYRAANLSVDVSRALDEGREPEKGVICSLILALGLSPAEATRALLSSRLSLDARSPREAILAEALARSMDIDVVNALLWKKGLPALA